MKACARQTSIWRRPAIARDKREHDHRRPGPINSLALACSTSASSRRSPTCPSESHRRASQPDGGLLEQGRASIVKSSSCLVPCATANALAPCLEIMFYSGQREQRTNLHHPASVSSRCKVRVPLYRPAQRETFMECAADLFPTVSFSPPPAGAPACYPMVPCCSVWLRAPAQERVALVFEGLARRDRDVPP